MYIKLDHIGSIWINLNHIGSKWIKLVLKNIVFSKLAWSWQTCQSWHGLYFNLNLSTHGLRLTCTGIFRSFDFLQFEISSLMNCIFFLVWKQTDYFYQFKLHFFSSFWARVKFLRLAWKLFFSTEKCRSRNPS